MNDIKDIIEDVEKSNLVSDNVIKKVIKIIGQEEWNNIHDEESDICTTTGELIITLKGIAELEKENAELKEENKFLKEQCLILADGNVCNSTCSEIKKQLTKAKEIIKDYLTIVKGAHTTLCSVPEENRTIYVLKLNEEAEQFIKEMKND